MDYKNLSDGIQEYILDLFDENDEDFLSLRRKDLAELFSCVPSQINYVLKSRFSPEHGFLTESRRGGYGYIKILRVCLDAPADTIKHIKELIGNEISLHNARNLLKALNERDLISDRERLLIEIALLDLHESNRRSAKNIAELLKKMLIALAGSEDSSDEDSMSDEEDY